MSYTLLRIYLIVMILGVYNVDGRHWLTLVCQHIDYIIFGYAYLVYDVVN